MNVATLRSYVCHKHVDFKDWHNINVSPVQDISPWLLCKAAGILPLHMTTEPGGQPASDQLPCRGRSAPAPCKRREGAGHAAPDHA